jgi:hypothetical protein
MQAFASSTVCEKKNCSGNTHLKNHRLGRDQSFKCTVKWCGSSSRQVAVSLMNVVWNVHRVILACLSFFLVLRGV